jgi:arylsulfatase A-like enzyme
MAPRLNILLLVVDSLRADLFAPGVAARPATPFLDRLGAETIHFRRAYAAECWTLPSHVSMFTGLLPSQHGAHFRSMAYAGRAPLVAEVLGAAGYRTELVTRNFVFDGTLPGVTRGFAHTHRPLADAPRWHPVPLLLALAKPRFRRHLRATGFFHPRHGDSRRFLQTFARALWPADELALDRVLDRLAAARRRGTPAFVFCNLYDVHAPYAPTPRSILRPWRSLAGAYENLLLPGALARLGTHAYLREGFRISAASRRLLRDRYLRAVELMDAKLAAFFGAARASGALDDTLVVLASDHGEAFGDHELYLHDASVYETHLHVPLWIHHPELAAQRIDDVVSTRDLFGLLTAIGRGDGPAGTILDPAYRAAHPIALAEHVHYPHLRDAQPRYRQDLAAAIGPAGKIVLRDGGVVGYDLAADPREEHPRPTTLGEFAAQCVRGGSARQPVEAALAHLLPRAAALAGGGPPAALARDSPRCL